MLNFVNDYSEGAHELVLKKLVESNMESLEGYGCDRYSDEAKEKIKRACQCPEADVYFLIGGTQTNQVVIDSILKAYEGVITAQSGHINVHEAGAIEFTGHKVIPLRQMDGKLSASVLKEYLDNFYTDENRDHMVFPGMVYLSHPTEFGTLYTKAELQQLSQICHAYEIPLYMDGARLGYGLACLDNDLTLPDIAKLCDVFYIGGTKVGALCGEAVVFTKRNTPKQFVTLIKQHGALLAKGRLTGVQFDALFTDDLYIKIGKHAIDMAEKIKKALQEKGYSFYINSPTNQIFLILENEQLRELKKKVKYSFWEKQDDTHTIIRLATSWATAKESVEQLISIL